MFIPNMTRTLFGPQIDALKASQSNTNGGLRHWGFSLQKSIPPWAFCLAVGVDRGPEMFGDARILSTCRRKSTARGTSNSCPTLGAENPFREGHRPQGVTGQTSPILGCDVKVLAVVKIYYRTDTSVSLLLNLALLDSFFTMSP